jgi:serpin B
MKRMKRAQSVVAAALAFALLLPALPAFGASLPAPKVKSVAAHAVALIWEEASGSEGYEIVRAYSENGDYKKTGESKAPEYLDKGLTVGVKYFYKVRSFKTSGGEKSYSSYGPAAPATPLPGNTAILAALPEGESVQKILWKEVSGAASYQLERSAAGSAFTLLAEPKEPFYTDQGLAKGVSYQYRVRAAAKDASGTPFYGAYSAPATGLAAPMPVPIKAAGVTKHEATIAVADGTYTDVGGVELFRTCEGETVFLGEIDLSTCLFTDTNLASGKTYVYKSKSFKTGEGGKKIAGMYSEAETVTTLKSATDDPFVNAAAQLSVDLMQLTASVSENTAVSAVSLLPSLAVTANTAQRETKEQIVEALSPGMSLDELSKRVAEFTENNLVGSAVTVRQAILIPDDSAWEGALEKAGLPLPGTDILPKDQSSTVSSDSAKAPAEEAQGDPGALAIVNSAGLEGGWMAPYGDMDIASSEFHSVDSSKTSCAFMMSQEKQFLSDGSARGFVRPYADGKHSFAALLPNEGVRIDDYVRNLDGDKLMSTLLGAKEETVLAEIPRFAASSKTDMNGALRQLGVMDAFDPARAQFSSSQEGMHIGEIVNTAAISVNESGYLAMNRPESAAVSVADSLYVKLDRPFVYMVIDNETKIPVLMGVCMKAG